MKQCCLCNQKHTTFEITGMKRISKKENITFQLCKKCAKEMPPPANNSPEKARARQQYWEKVWSAGDLMPT